MRPVPREPEGENGMAAADQVVAQAAHLPRHRRETVNEHARAGAAGTQERAPLWEECRSAGSRHGQGAPVYGFVVAFSGTSQRTLSGGRVTSAENGCSCHGRASHSTPPRLPTSEPP